jgi:hypothetical protein
MGDGAAAEPQKDGFIAARKAELAQAITAEPGLPAADSATLTQVLKLLGALLHHEAYERLETLKALYDPLDPDAPLARRDVSVAAFERFEGALIEALTRANFTEIDPDTVQTRQTTKLLTGLAIKPSSAGIRSMRYFARGARAERIERKEWLGLRKRVIDAEVMNDVVVIVGFKADSEIQREDAKAFARMRRGVRPGAALVKSFRNVAAAELVTLHPGARPSMLRRDQFFLAAPAVVAGTPVLLNLWPALTVIFAVLAAYFGAQGVIDDNELKRALAAVSGLVAVGAFVMRQRLKYEAQTLRYQKQLADTVYFRNLANNAGVLDLLIGAGEEQDAKEAFLAYWTLHRSQAPLTKAEIDRAAEDFLRDRMGQRVDFEIQDALTKLERLGLVIADGERYCALAPDEALAKLDTAWDAVFDFQRHT